jgi:hypothetical protein
MLLECPPADKSLAIYGQMHPIMVDTEQFLIYWECQGKERLFACRTLSYEVLLHIHF